MSWAGGSPPARTFRKLMVFIDGSNFLAGIADLENKSEKKYKINFKALEQVLIENAHKHSLIIPEHIKTFFYGPKGVPEELKSSDFSKRIEEFEKELKANYVRVILKEKIKGKEKGVDVALVTDFLSLAYNNAYDHVLLVSGDADFIGTIDEVKRLGKVIFIASFKSRFNEALLEHVDKVIYLDQFVVQFLTT